MWNISEYLQKQRFQSFFFLLFLFWHVGRHCQRLRWLNLLRSEAFPFSLYFRYNTWPGNITLLRYSLKTPLFTSKRPIVHNDRDGCTEYECDSMRTSCTFTTQVLRSTFNASHCYKQICFLALFCLASYFCEQCSIRVPPACVWYSCWGIMRNTFTFM